MVHHNKCPLCSSENITAKLQTADHFLTREIFTLYGCADCGFIFTNDHPDEGGIGHYYESEDYLSHNEPKGNLPGRIYGISRNVMLRKKVRIVQKATGIEKGSILDTGSGAGHFLNAMRNAGWNVTGIEINEKVRQYSASSFGLNVQDPGHLKTLPSESFDCITLWHVLEHFQDPLGYAKEIMRLLKPEGICIVALPNCASSDAAFFGTYWAAYDVPRHLWHFTPDTFKRFTRDTGFELVNILPLPLDVFYISILSEKYKGANLPFLSGMIRGFWFRILTLFNKERASSLIYILKGK